MDECALAAVIDLLNQLKSKLLAAQTSLEEQDFDSIDSDSLLTHPI